MCSVWDCPPSGPSWKQYNMTHRKTFRYTHLLTCMAVYWVAAHFDNPDCRLQPAACTAHKTLENVAGRATFLQAQPDHASQMLPLQSLFSSRLVCNTWGFSASLSIIKKNLINEQCFSKSGGYIRVASPVISEHTVLKKRNVCSLADWHSASEDHRWKPNNCLHFLNSFPII